MLFPFCRFFCFSLSSLLQKLSWRRVDVKLGIAANKLPHNYIQARPADEHSLSVTNHLMDVLSN